MRELLLGLAIASPASAQVVDSSLAITNVSVVDVVAGVARPGSTVVVRGNRIVAVGPTAAVRVPVEARTIDGSRRFLIPGLWDMHVHLGNAGEESLAEFVKYGVTGVRDMGTERFERLREWRVEILSGARVGPRIVAAGPIVDGPTPNWPLRVTVPDAASARRAVDSLAAVGVDFIKVHQQLTRDAYFAVAAEARRLNIAFAGHVPVVVKGNEAAEAGQRSVEHLTGLPDTRDSTWVPFLRAYKKHGTWMDPTLITYWAIAHHRDSAVINDPRAATISESLKKFWVEQQSAWSGDLSQEGLSGLYRSMKDHLKGVYQEGIPILTGTDLGFVYVYPGSSLHEEMEHLVEAGMRPIDALRAATINPARYLGRDRELGTIEVNKLADMVLLDANPITAISNTKRIRAVVANGRAVDLQGLP